MIKIEIVNSLQTISQMLINHMITNEAFQFEKGLLLSNSPTICIEQLMNSELLDQLIQ